MKVRVSGMPEESHWESLFDVPLILDRLRIDARLKDVIELGCGYGTFTLPVARRISGVIEALDIEHGMIERTRHRAEAAGLRNVRYQLRDVMRDGFGGEPESRDACLLFNILHCGEPVYLLTEAARSVHLDGRVLVVHWDYDPATPRGPGMDIRPRPDQIAGWATQTGGLQLAGGIIDLPPWPNGLRLRRKAPSADSRKSRAQPLGTISPRAPTNPSASEARTGEVQH
jgi:SAM-dependent methyltransferase